ncbi:hypothetical protein Dsin_002181 [Dipteronia sinensis]|uniref:Uncharacterized protein n=1 Tax=Dipteronia sinensis TaxID=43782 RepID=A0AAE0B6Q5_9ROSI|nr:hypothetical protein Dsin_002181 [Dipteronia sinensis]
MFVAMIQDGIEQAYPLAFSYEDSENNASYNIKKRFYKKAVAEVMVAVVKSYRELKYNRHMEELRNLHNNAFDYVVNASLEKWSCVHYPQRRFRLMTTNIAECLNSCLRFAQKLPMMTLAKFIRNML